MTTNTSVRHTSYADQYKIVAALTVVGLYGRVTPLENGLLVDRDVAAQELGRVYAMDVSPRRVRTAAESFKHLSWPYPETPEDAAKILTRKGCYHGQAPTEPRKLTTPALHPALRLVRQPRPKTHGYGH